MKSVILLMLVIIAFSTVVQALPAVNELPPNEYEFGFRPQGAPACKLDPPGFVWRPQEDADTYELQISGKTDFKTVAYQASGIRWNIHHPTKQLGTGTWYWRFRYTNKNGETSPWSSVRRFEISKNAVALPHPTREQIRALIPQSHPRVMLRSEDLPRLRQGAVGELAKPWDSAEKSARLFVTRPLPAEPPLYPDGKRDINDNADYKMWGDNWQMASRHSGEVANVAFAYLISGRKDYLDAATKALLNLCSWDTKGSTGYLYNDEAGMPITYNGARAYDWAYEGLSEKDRNTVRQMLVTRGRDIYEHLRKAQHTWMPYGSHRNRAWHFLGETAVALYGEEPEAEEWLEYALDIFFCCYPVWSDEDGGWHEGVAYWHSYMGRVTWWLDTLRAALKMDPYQLPFFRQVGDFILYQLPPGTKCGTYADQATRTSSESVKPLMGEFARGAGNPYWAWYAGDISFTGFLGYLRASRVMPKPKPPTDIPTSKCFRGTGIAALNTNLVDGTKNVQWIFKSSPMGLDSHGYNAQNSFWLNLGGEPLLISTGERDGYGSIHHQGWMWETKSCNSLLVDGIGQVKHKRASKGEIVDFQHSERYDYVAGEAAKAYGDRLNSFRREMLFVQPGLMLIFDRVVPKEPATYQWLLHAPVPFEMNGQKAVAKVPTGFAEINWLEPEGLSFTQTDKFDPPNSIYKDLVQYHLTAEIREKTPEAMFLTAIRPVFKDQPEPAPIRTIRRADRIQAVIPQADGEVRVWVSRTGKPISVRDGKLSFEGCALVLRTDKKGALKDAFVIRATKLANGQKTLFSSKQPATREVGNRV